MIPVLYKPSETDFTTHGLGMLSDAEECKVSEQINDEYELSLTYPANGIHFADIQRGCLIKALVSDGTEQLFRIYDIGTTYPDCEISAEHISYQTNGIIVRPFSASTASSAMSGLKRNSINANPFSFFCSLSESGNYNCDVPASIKSQLSEFLKVFGGELYYNNYSISLVSQRGQKRNVTLRYGKNIVSLKQDQNIEDTYSGVVGYWKGRVNEADQTVTGNIISTNSSIPHERLMVLDVSSDINTDDNVAASVSQVDSAVRDYIARNKPGVPKISLEIDIADLWQTDEYKNLAPIEKIELGDTVTIIFEKLNISEDTRAVRIEWDVLNERNDTVTFGEVERTYADDVEDQQQAVDDAQSAADDAQTSADEASEKADKVREAVNEDISALSLNIGTIEEEQKGMKTQIQANAEGLTTTVQKGEIISTINQSAEGVSINANRIDLAGYVTAVDLKTGGATTINGANIETGTISADKIDAGTLNTGALYVNGSPAIEADNNADGEPRLWIASIVKFVSAAEYNRFQNITYLDGGARIKNVMHGATSDKFLRIDSDGNIVYTDSAATS